eukprot:TRINITY_DN9775_c0_g2_i1.p1 TRINITY_DN9775_c0_g2~~TRINITY_DN9775_c0_g2_i1.p1  ORF type:complete len:468 (-),score=43.34 TRINITY_DN9775_c0_g2_i1:185-1588(-)
MNSNMVCPVNSSLNGRVPHLIRSVTHKKKASNTAIQIFQEMKNQDIQPTAATYGCVLRACETLGDVQLAFKIYLEASKQGVLPSDECHNILINVCTKANRLDEALELIKALARGKGTMQIHTINSLTRALCDRYPDRAVRMLRLMNSKKIETQRETYLELVSACAKSGKSQISLDLYVEMRQLGYIAESEPVSRLVQSLCTAGNFRGLGLVLEDQLKLANGETEFPIVDLPPTDEEQQEFDSYQDAQTSKKQSSTFKDLPWTYKWLHQDLEAAGINIIEQVAELVEETCRLHLNSDQQQINVVSKPLVADMEGMAALLMLLARNNKLNATKMAYILSLNLYPEDFPICTTRNRRMFESLINVSCQLDDIAFGLRVFDDWKAGCIEIKLKGRNGELGKNFVPPKLSSVTLAYLEACCRQKPEFEWRVYDVCAAMRQQREQSKQAKLSHPTKTSHHFKEVDSSDPDSIQ